MKGRPPTAPRSKVLPTAGRGEANEKRESRRGSKRGVASVTQGQDRWWKGTDDAGHNNEVGLGGGGGPNQSQGGCQGWKVNASADAGDSMTGGEKVQKRLKVFTRRASTEEKKEKCKKKGNVAEKS